MMKKVLKNVGGKNLALGLKESPKKCIPDSKVVVGRAKRSVYAGRHIQFGNRVKENGGNKFVFQVRVSFVKDVQKQEAWWERQHELVAENFGFYRLYSVLIVEAIGLACLKKLRKEKSLRKGGHTFLKKHWIKLENR
nr:hypothetical protein CFP56_71969 [Quercus suber]